MKIFLQQSLKVLGLTVLVVGLVYILQVLEVKGILHSDIWSIVIFSSVVGLGVASINMYFVKKGSDQGIINVFLATTVFRMLFSIIFITLKFFNGLENEVLWIVDFFVVYLFYLVFEIYSIISNLRAISNEGETND